MIKLVSKKSLSSLFLVLGIVMNVHAAESDKDGRKQGRNGPPAEALAACENLSVDQACSFSSPRGNATGTCIVPKNDSSSLACKPAGRDRSRSSD